MLHPIHLTSNMAAILVTVEHPNDLQLGFTNESPVERVEPETVIW